MNFRFEDHKTLGLLTQLAIRFNITILNIKFMLLSSEFSGKCLEMHGIRSRDLKAVNNWNLEMFGHQLSEEY